MSNECLDIYLDDDNKSQMSSEFRVSHAFDISV